MISPAAGRPRPEYPRPQFARDEWLSLNGTWQFEFDPADDGELRGLRERDLRGEILVPFAPESAASGIGDTGFHDAVWYRRTVDIPAEWAGRIPFLHFGAVDHDATVWIDGVEAGRHRGGFTPFSVRLPTTTPGTSVVIVVRARDHRDAPQARGKQARTLENEGCFYTRTTGIWQTVWLEPVPPVHLLRPQVLPDLAAGTFRIRLPLSANSASTSLGVEVSDDDGLVCSVTVRADLGLTPEAVLRMPEDRIRTWSPEDPFLYGIAISLNGPDGEVLDSARTYGGLRSIGIDGRRILLNGRPVFQRLVLDQGYWPDSVLTAPSDEALARDILLAQAAGFNGARLHQRIAEERYLYHADRLGFMVWAEFPDWGTDGRPTASYLTQWIEAIGRDVSHPSIVGWCPLNEVSDDGADGGLDDVARGMLLAAKAIDPSRPVVDVSGFDHRLSETDIWDLHDYEQDPALLSEHLAERPADQATQYRGQPVLLSEFGGIWWDPDATTTPADRPDSGAWGYGSPVRSEEEFLARFEGVVGAVLSEPGMAGFCYTQLVDVFQEQNGLYRFDRSQKVDLARVRRALTGAAAYERNRG